MAYATLMAHLELAQSNAQLLKVAAALAERFHAGVIGIVASQPSPVVFSDGYISSEFIQKDKEQIDSEVAIVEAEFRAAMASCARPVGWRSSMMCESIASYVAQQARSADLVITGGAPTVLFDGERHVDRGDLVLHCGRPVLIVPGGSGEPRFDNMLICWKDTRETRRAVLDALPLLQKASRVAMVELAAESNLAAARTRLEDVAGWLASHDVRTELIATTSEGDVTRRLNNLAIERDIDVIVAGAYGHSRLREWVFGSVTTGLLLPKEHCSFVSH